MERFKLTGDDAQLDVRPHRHVRQQLEGVVAEHLVTTGELPSGVPGR